MTLDSGKLTKSRKVLEKILGIPYGKFQDPPKNSHHSLCVEEHTVPCIINDDRETVYNVEMECRNAEKAFLPKQAKNTTDAFATQAISQRVS